MKIKKIALLTLAVFLSTAVFVFAQNGNRWKLSSKAAVSQRAEQAPSSTLAPATGDGWMYYDNGTYETNIGTGGGTLYWAIMLPAATLTGNTLEKVSVYENEYNTEPITILIYSGGETAPEGDVVYTQTVTPVGGDVFHEITLTNPVTIDLTKNLWIVLSEEGTYPAAACANTGDVNGRWISLDGTDWIDVVEAGLNYSWMLRAYLTGEGNVNGDVDTTLFTFDDSTMEGWTTIDADGDGYTWVLGSQVGGVYLVEGEGGTLAGTGHNASADLVTSGSYSNFLSAALTPDNYLVSPKTILGGKITFWACGQDASYPAEHFGVAVSTAGNTDAADFTTIWESTMTAAPAAAPAAAQANAFKSAPNRGPRRAQGNWYQFTVDLSAYAGQEGYVAIRHFGCTDMFLLNVDDIELAMPEVESTGYDLSSVSNHGNVTFTVDGEEVTKAEEGKTVTVTVTPDENCFVDDIKATAYADWGDAQAPQQNNALLKDVELTPAGENTWTFTMPGAKVEVTVTYKKNVTVNVAGGDLSAALEDASEGLPICNLNLNLTGSEYTVSAPMVASGNVVVNGNGATIDASALNDAFIVLDGTEEFAKKADGTDSDHKLIDVVTVKSITIKGMKGAFIKDNQKTLLQKLTVDNCVIEMPASNKNFIDFNGKGYVGEVKVQNSTIWAADKNTGFFAQYGSRPKNVNGDWLQVFDVQNSDIINIANGKNVCDLKQNGTAQNVYILKDNIFVDCGKNGQTVVGFNKGQASATPQWEVTGNSFVWGGVCTNAAEAEKAGNDIVQNSVDGVPEFADAANGDFTLGASSIQRKYRVGDPRWFTEYYVYPAVTAAIDVNVPAMLGKMDVETTGDPTDLYYFLQSSYLNNSENPAYIKLTLEPGAIYTISQPLQVLTAIEIVGDAENPAMIDARELGANPFVQIMSDKVSIQDNNEPNAKGFFTNIYNVSFKNIRLENLKGQLFYANKQKYLIPYMTVDNCTIRMVGASKKTFFDFSGGGFVELLTINNSTLSADDATTWANGGFFSTQSGTKFEDCGAERQKFVLTNNTFYNVCKGKTTSTLRENSKAFMDFEVINNIFVNSGKKGEFVTGLNAGQNKATPNWVVNYNAFQWTEDNKTFEDISATEATKGSNCGISGSIAGEIAFLYAVDNADELLPIILIGNYTLADCPQKSAKTGDPRWIDGGTTGIQTLNAENSEKLSEGAWYTIQGVRVDKPSKGVFIHNGKKVVVK